MTKELREPISWFDDSLVDFGDYKTSKNRYSTNDEFIRFSYKMHGPYNVYNFYLFYDLGLPYMEYIDNTDEIELSISYACDKEGTFINKIEFVWQDNRFLLQISDRKDQVQVTINDEISPGTEWYWDQSTNRGMFPRNYIQFQNGKHIMFAEHMYSATISTLRGYCSKRLTNEHRLKSVISHCSADRGEFLYYLQSKCDITSLKK